MIGKKTCDICGKDFNKTDDYINGNVDLTYVEYAYDAGSLDNLKHFDVCQKCLKIIYDLIIEQQKKTKQKTRKKKTKQKTRKKKLND